MDNPYRAPEAEIRVVGLRSGRREDLRKVAQAQRVLILCILAGIVSMIALPVLPRLSTTQLAPVAALAALGASLVYLGSILVAAVFMFILAVRVYSTAVGILMGVLTLIPCIGLLALLQMNQKATTILRENGIKVGFLGADLSQFR